MQRNTKCLLAAQKELKGDEDNDDLAYMTADENMGFTTVSYPTKRITKPHLPVGRFALPPLKESSDAIDNYETAHEFSDTDPDDLAVPGNDSDEDAPDFGSAEEDMEAPDTSILANFRDYVAYCQSQHLPFTKTEEDIIDLLYQLRHSKASLDTFEVVYEWHLRANGMLPSYETLGNSPHYISRKRIFKMLSERYNMPKDHYNIPKVITLPSSGARAKLILNDVRACMQSLLTDPRIRSEDYHFFDDNPFSPPPADNDVIGHLNTGLAYYETYKHLIKKPNQVLLPCPMYVDGTVTSTFTDHPITQFKFTIGILSRKARDREECWRILGYLPKIRSAKSKGRRIFRDSKHVDSQRHCENAPENEGVEKLTNEKINMSEDMHAMLDEVLAGFVELQHTGFIWDLPYNGELHRVEFVPFVPFIKADTEEADKLCGSYTSRASKVAQLCRYCECPTGKSDDPHANYRLKTVKQVQKLVDKGDMEGLRAISQQYVQNAMYNLQFGTHSGQGVHGSCPMEMLHALLLGIFKYARDCFFEQMGPTSQLAKLMNGLAVNYGQLFARQSDRDMPKAKFSNGIQEGKLMAKEFTGVLLCMVACLRSTRGQNLLRTKKKKHFGSNAKISDWIMLIEILLQWEEWLKSEEMEKKHVHRAQKKHRYIMWLMRKIGNRTEGMGLKIVKFHGITHMATDIINFGVPLEFDTGACEHGHGDTKKAAKLTQKRVERFDEQVSTRLLECHLLALAMEEMSGRPVWSYAQGFMHEEEMDLEQEKHDMLGGAKVAVNSGGVEIKSRGKKTVTLEQAYVKFCKNLRHKVHQHIDVLIVHSLHRRNGQNFRASASYDGHVWRDWALVDWGSHGKLPCKLWGFVDLTELPAGRNGVEHGGLKHIPPGNYAIVESSEYLEEEDGAVTSELLEPILKEVGPIDNNGNVTDLCFYLADVEAIVDPLVVIPDIGGAPNAYFVVKGRSEWRELFIKWLEAPHYHDDMQEEEEIEESSEDEEEDDTDNEEEEGEEIVVGDSDEEDSDSDDDSDEEDSD